MLVCPSSDWKQSLMKQLHLYASVKRLRARLLDEAVDATRHLLGRARRRRLKRANIGYQRDEKI
jgi:hypothetical protein